MLKTLTNLLFFGASLILFAGCKEDAEEPKALEIETTSAYNIGFYIATTGGTIISDGGSSITARGVCWSTSPNPEVTDSKTSDGNGKGNFVSHLSGLTAGETYYLRAYAFNSKGTAYGNEVSFSAAGPFPPTITTTNPLVARYTALSGGTITSDGAATITARGICWSTNPNPTIDDNKTDEGTGLGAFASVMSNLEATTNYYVRAYATNSAGTGYGPELSLTTLTVGNNYSGIYKITGGSIYRDLGTGSDPVLGGDYIVGTPTFIQYNGTNSVIIILIWANNTTVGSIAPVSLIIDPTVTLPDGSHPVTISSTSNLTLTNTDGADNKFFPGDGNTPDEFLLNFEWYGTGLIRQVSNYRLTLMGE